MGNGIGQDGIIDRDKLKKSTGFPSEERLAEGPVAIIECLEEIPCNPCESICPQAAIKVGKPLTNLPVFLEEKCNGCTLCIPHCPGMAIFIVDLTYSKNEAIICFPYEFYPLPAVQDEVDAVDREGEIVTKAKVKGMRNPQRFDQTAIISLIVPKDLAMEVRSIQISDEQRAMGDGRWAKTTKINASGSKQEPESGELIPHPSSLIPRMVCRCEEVERTEINRVFEHGVDSIKGIKDRTRVGMGLCQGRVCAELSRRLLVQNTNIGPEHVKPPSVRPPVRPVELGILALGAEDD